VTFEQDDEDVPDIGTPSQTSLPAPLEDSPGVTAGGADTPSNTFAASPVLKGGVVHTGAQSSGLQTAAASNVAPIVGAAPDADIEPPADD